MPQLLLRGLSPATRDAVRAYARARALSTSDGAVALLVLGLQVTEARASGARAVNAGRTPDERSQAARHAVQARYAPRPDR
jgi:hypothetical protein